MYLHPLQHTAPDRLHLGQRLHRRVQIAAALLDEEEILFIFPENFTHPVNTYDWLSRFGSLPNSRQFRKKLRLIVGVFLYRFYRQYSLCYI